MCLQPQATFQNCTREPRNHAQSLLLPKGVVWGRLEGRAGVCRAVGGTGTNWWVWWKVVLGRW